MPPAWLRPIGRVFPAVVIERTGFPRLTSASIAALQLQCVPAPGQAPQMAVPVAEEGSDAASTFSAISAESMPCVSVSAYAREYMHVDEGVDGVVDVNETYGADGALGALSASSALGAEGEEGCVRYIDEDEAETMQQERQRHVTGSGVYYYPRFARPALEKRAQKAPRRGCIEPGSVVFTFGNVVGGVLRRTLLGRNVAQTRQANFNARVERRGDVLVVVAVDQILVFREIVVDRQWADHVAI